MKLCDSLTESDDDKLRATISELEQQIELLESIGETNLKLEQKNLCRGGLRDFKANQRIYKTLVKPRQHFKD